MRYYMDQREPQVLDIKKLMRACRNKDHEARAEINEYMENCAKMANSGRKISIQEATHLAGYKRRGGAEE